MYNAYAHVGAISWDKLRKDLLGIFCTITGADYVRKAVNADDLATYLVDQVSQLEIHCYLTNTLFRDLDTFSMAHSLEVRVPLLNHRLLEVLAHVSGADKIIPQTNICMIKQ